MPHLPCFISNQFRTFFRKLKYKYICRDYFITREYFFIFVLLNIYFTKHISSLNAVFKCMTYTVDFCFLFLSALNLRRRPWYAHLLSCPPPLPPKWTLKCPIRVNPGALAANHSSHHVTPRPWVPKGLRMYQGEWG